ncbi:hypothetical protein [Micromonospora tulbaghiae]|uniref:hypothetical protein n=1 Tax=Micromonospora tulbaghiae TaxID=479978 RepID=UPI003433D371
MTDIDITTPVSCTKCGVSRRLHTDADHPYQPADMRLIVARATARKQCTHWIGDQDRYCGSTDQVRPFLQGPRCKAHDPNTMKARTAA